MPVFRARTHPCSKIHRTPIRLADGRDRKNRIKPSPCANPGGVPVVGSTEKARLSAPFRPRIKSDWFLRPCQHGYGLCFSPGNFGIPSRRYAAVRNPGCPAALFGIPALSCRERFFLSVLPVPLRFRTFPRVSRASRGSRREPVFL